MNVSFGYGTPPAASNIVNANSYPQTMVDNIESNHSVGACAAFCDGHVILLRGDTDCALGDVHFRATGESQRHGHRFECDSG